MNTDGQLSKAIGYATMALRDIAARNDCDYEMQRAEDRPNPCPCSKCVASSTLELIEEGPANWRYIGAHAERIRHSPRERKIVDAWRSQADDKILGMVLSDYVSPDGKYERVEAPTARDWYVATSVVQWLATNVGMEVLRRAGFQYTMDDEDRKERERREQDGGQ